MRVMSKGYLACVSKEYGVYSVRVMSMGYMVCEDIEYEVFGL